ncbi:NAD(P)-binding domain-containing protein [bacterium]|nr:NAD(P)-binding domain-containing protein [bacterium]
MSTITLMGAGGKMGCRITDNLRKSGHTVYYVEVAPQGIGNLAKRGIKPTAADMAVPKSDVLILAVPDRAIEQVSHATVPLLPKGALVMVLDPAAPYGEELPKRADIAYFVTHPCHPPVINDETDPEAKQDFFGGIKAKQHIVCALMQGDDKDYERGVAIAREIFAPVMRAHRITVEQMAILEPAMSETVAATLLLTIREALDEAIKAGVPEQAAWDFMLGHIWVDIGIMFGGCDAKLSDGARKAVERARKVLLQPDWKRVFSIDYIKEEIKAITKGE